MDQYASKVVEKCLKIGGNEFLERYLDRVCEGRSDRPRIPLIDSTSISQIRKFKANPSVSCERSIRELPCPMDTSTCLTSTQGASCCPYPQAYGLFAWKQIRFPGGNALLQSDVQQANPQHSSCDCTSFQQVRVSLGLSK